MDQVDELAELVVAKTRHYLVTTMGRTPESANDEEFYRALSYALREQVVVNWLTTVRTIEKHDARIIYYFSQEYMPGRIFSSNVTSMNEIELVKMVLQKMNRNFVQIMNREAEPGLGNGGLGRLASCLLDSLATLHYPAQGYGLRYHYGIFEQQLRQGVQIEAPDCWLVYENPWEFKRDMRRIFVKFGGEPESTMNIHGDEIMLLKNYEEVWAVPYDIPIVGYDPNGRFSVVTLRLWTTKESPRNFQLQRYNAGKLDEAAENTTLTDVLYPSDNHEVGKRIRLKQEFLLVSSSIQDIIRHYRKNHDNFRDFSDKVRIQINDTHPALVIPELVRILTKEYDLPWKTAVDITQACCGYTNHTILSEALEQWDINLFYYLLPRQYKVIERLNHDFCSQIRQRFPNDEERVQRMSIIEDGKVRMASLAAFGSHRVNGVAALHSEIIKHTLFKDFSELYPDKFINVTNGVTHRRWLLHSNPLLAQFISSRIGDGWVTHFSEIERLRDFASDRKSLEELWNIKKRNKQRLLDFIKRENRMHNAVGQPIEPPPLIDVSSLFDVHIKRIHEYKRQLMNALHIIMLYHEILENPNADRSKRTFIFGGKAAAGYETAKDIIRLIFCIGRKVNRDPQIRGLIKVLYIENYNVSRAEMIIPAAELSEQISTAGMEASGTGNMKLSMNGALTIGTDDGANIEMRQSVTDAWWPFMFGHSAEEITKMKAEQSYSAKEVYQNNPRIKKAVDALRDRSFAINEEEHQVLCDLYHKLIEGHYGGAPDRYFTLSDLQAYYETQKRVEELYKDPVKWAEYSMHNIAGMGPFSADVSIQNYAEKVWGIEPCELDEEIYERIAYEYAEHSQLKLL